MPSTPQTNRQVHLEGQNNCRDLGGHPTEDGRRVRIGRIYRSGELIDLTDRDLGILAELGIRTVIDLRGEEEAEKKGPDRLPPGASLRRVPIEPGDLSHMMLPAFSTGDFSVIPEDLLLQINRDYVQSWGHRLAEVIRIAADPGLHGVVFHCTQGKDRAGVSAAILLSALGVPWEHVMEDYLHSNLQRREQAEGGVEGMRQSAARRRKIAPEEVDVSNVRGLFFVDPSYLGAAHAEILNLHGSVDAFIRDGMGIEASELKQLRDCLLE